MTKTLALAAVCAFALTSAAFAAPTNNTMASSKPTTATAPATPKGPAMTAPKTPEAKACSDQANAQGLHGKARKEFRSKCKAAATKPADATASTPKT